MNRFLLLILITSKIGYENNTKQICLTNVFFSLIKITCISTSNNPALLYVDNRWSVFKESTT